MRHKNIIKSFFIYFLLIFTFLLIHELAHGITAIIFGGEFKGIWLTSYFGFGEKSNDVSAFAFYTCTSYNNSILCYSSVKITGSLISIIFASIVNYNSRKKRNSTVFLATYNAIFYEILYWALSPLLKFGDAYQLLQSLKITNLIEILVFSLILFMVLTFISISFTKTYKKLYFSINKN